MRTDLDYRDPKHRWEGFDMFYRYMLETHEWSPDIVLERWLLDDMNADFEMRCTMAFFHGATHAGPVESAFAVTFPTVTADIIPEMTEWYQKYKKKLIFSPDCKYRKIVFEKFLKSVGDSLTTTLGDYIKKSFTVGTDIENYNDLKSRCMNDWFHWGRMGHWSFVEAMVGMTDAPLEAPDMEFATGKSHRSGWAFAIGRDDLVDTDDISKDDMEMLERTAKEYVESVDHPNANFLNFETCCCNYKRQHKGTRYAGCYTDEQELETEEARHLMPEFEWLWDKYMKARPEVLPHSVLAEMNPEQWETPSAYVASMNKALSNYGRIPRAEAWHNKTPQFWTEVENQPFARTSAAVTDLLF